MILQNITGKVNHILGMAEQRVATGVKSMSVALPLLPSLRTVVMARRILALLLLALLCLWPNAGRAQALTYTNTDTTSATISETATPCTAPLIRSFTVSTSYLISDVNIGVLLSHSYRGDMTISLVSPTGTRVQLQNQIGGTRNNQNVLFDDAAASSIASHTSSNDSASWSGSYQRTFRPQSLLSAFNGANAQGTWTLEICDSLSGDSGAFVRSDLYITALTGTWADLSLTGDISNNFPANGSSVTYTLNVTNSALSTGTPTNVVVRDALPAGLSFVSYSYSGGGTYNSGTGDWTITSIPPGVTLTMTITATVTASAGNTISNYAQVSANAMTDPDSTPNNNSNSEDDDVTITALVAGGGGAGIPPVLTCPAGSSLFDWDASGVQWTTGNSTGSFPFGSFGSVGFGISMNSGIWLSDVNFGGQTPAESSYYTAGIYTGQSGLHLLADFVSSSSTAVIAIQLTNAAEGAQFIISDVDDGGAQFRDKITVTGSHGGVSVTPTLTRGAANTVSGNVATGTATSDATSADGNLIVTFSAPVDYIVIAYGTGAGGPSAPGQQGIALHDITLCNPKADIAVSKTSVVSAIGTNRPFSIPGNDVIYAISVSNSGASPLTANSLFLVDTIPAGISFFNGDFNGALPGTDSVVFSDSSSGLSWTFASDVKFAGFGPRPTNPGQCTYTPMAGYDANVRYICFNPKGSLAGSSGGSTPGFSVSFRAQIE